MSHEPYTIFHKASYHLVKEYKLRRSGKTSPGQNIPSVLVILVGKFDGITSIDPPFSHTPPFSGLVFSDIEDKAGPIPELASRQYTLKVPQELLNHVKVTAGERIQVHALLDIRPPGTGNGGGYLIEYHNGDGMFYLGFKGVVFLEPA